MFTTDPPLKTGKYIVLKDTKFIFGFQNVGLVVKTSVVTARAPRSPDDQQGQQPAHPEGDHRAERGGGLDKQSAAKVARAFLKANGLS